MTVGISLMAEIKTMMATETMVGFNIWQKNAAKIIEPVSARGVGRFFELRTNLLHGRLDDLCPERDFFDDDGQNQQRLDSRQVPPGEDR